MNKIAIICPTYGRPDTFNEVHLNWIETNAGYSDFYFVLEKSEQHLTEKTEANCIIVEQGQRGCNRPFYHACQELKEKYSYLAFVGDDHRFRVKDWDKKFIEALQTAWLVYGPEGYHNENLATACAFRSEIVKKLGYLVPPNFKHLYMDNVWMDIGKEMGIKYLPDVPIEHMHYLFGKAPHDEAYAAVNAESMYNEDRVNYENYKATQFEADIKKLKGGDTI